MSNGTFAAADPYSIYDRFDFDIPTCENGDSYDRYWIKMQEMRQSVRILEQAIKQMPEGPDQDKRCPNSSIRRSAKSTAVSKLPKGELGFYIVSDNSIAPYRLHIRPAELINLTALEGYGNRMEDS